MHLIIIFCALVSLEWVTEKIIQLLRSRLAKNIFDNVYLTIVDGKDEGVPALSLDHFGPQQVHDAHVMLVAIHASRISAKSVIIDVE